MFLVVAVPAAAVGQADHPDDRSPHHERNSEVRMHRGMAVRLPNPLRVVEPIVGDVAVPLPDDDADQRGAQRNRAKAS